MTSFRKARTVAIVAALTVAGAATTVAQDEDSAARPCSAPEYRQFDFWVGEWDVSWPDGSGQLASGSNTIRLVLDDCVLLESFDGGDMGLVGKSVSTFNRRIGAWQQTWVDNQGNYLSFTGGCEDGKMILVLEDPVVLRGRELPDSLQGAEAQFRMVWLNITPNRLDWRYERSLDGGASWELV